MKNYPTLFLLGFAISHNSVIYAQDFYKWVDANGSTHYTLSPPPHNTKKLGSISTYQNTAEQPRKNVNPPQPTGNSYQPSFPSIPKIELTAAERAEIEIKVKQQLKENKADPYATMFGAATEKDIRASIEAAYLQKKEKLANSNGLSR